MRAVLLDLDGVLLDHVGAARAGLQRWPGTPPTPRIEAAWFAAEDRWVGEWRAGAVSWAEQRRNRLRDVLPLLGRAVGADAELDRLFEDGYLVGYRASWRAFPDALPAIAALRSAGVRLGVLTNGSEAQSPTARPPRRSASRRNRRSWARRDELRAIGLQGAVGPVLTAEALGLSKPDPRASTTACERLGVAPADTLHVGDEHEVDVLGARAAGLQAVLLDRDGTGPAGERAVIRSLADLPGPPTSARMGP